MSVNEQTTIYDWERKKVSLSYYLDFSNNNKIGYLADATQQGNIFR